MAAAIAVAIAVDLLSGDPPDRWHPVAWMGSLLDWGRRRMARGTSGDLLVRGAVLVAVCATLAALVGSTTSSTAHRGEWLGVIVEGPALKLLLSLRDLASACLQVARALKGGNVVEARRLVGYHLVSRPTSAWITPRWPLRRSSRPGENLTDAYLRRAGRHHGIVAPLVFYLACCSRPRWDWRP
jgi:adenosylcobinamide-phosphate synthase